MSKEFKKRWIADWKRRMSKLSKGELELEKERRLRAIKRFEFSIKAAKWDISILEKLIKDKS